MTDDDTFGLGLTLTCGQSRQNPDPCENVCALAEAGDGAAARHLGDCYREGEPVKFSPRRACRWYARGANLGDQYAQGNLGLCYLHGHGVKGSRRTAIRWLKASAEQGNERATATLAALQAGKVQPETG